MHISQSYIDNIQRTLKDVPMFKTLYFQCEIGDWTTLVTKQTLLSTAEENMPGWFFQSMRDVRIEGNHVYPVFTPVEQAAWDAAQLEYVKQKGEYCADYGNE